LIKTRLKHHKTVSKNRHMLRGEAGGPGQYDEGVTRGEGAENPKFTVTYFLHDPLDLHFLSLYELEKSYFRLFQN